jgi:hypothetical protein
MKRYSFLFVDLQFNKKMPELDKRGWKCFQFSLISVMDSVFNLMTWAMSCFSMLIKVNYRVRVFNLASNFGG